MRFKKIYDVMSSVKALIESKALLQEVLVVNLTSYDNLLALLPYLTNFPAAAITLGSADFSDKIADREMEIAVIVVDEFCATNDAKAQSSCHVLDELTEMLQSNVPGQFLRLDDSIIKLDGIDAVEVDPSHAAWKLTVKVKNAFLRS